MSQVDIHLLLVVQMMPPPPPLSSHGHSFLFHPVPRWHSQGSVYHDVPIVKPGADPVSRYEAPQLDDKDQCPVFYPDGYQPKVTVTEFVQALPVEDEKLRSKQKLRRRFTQENAETLTEAIEKYTDCCKAHDMF